LSTSVEGIGDWLIGRRWGGGIVDDGSGVGLLTGTEGDRELTCGDWSCNREKSWSRNAGCIPSAIKSSYVNPMARISWSDCSAWI